MCNCKIAWVKNPEIEGKHNMRPVTCSEYIDTLEQALDAVSPQVLTFLRQDLGIEKSPDSLIQLPL